MRRPLILMTVGVALAAALASGGCGSASSASSAASTSSGAGTTATAANASPSGYFDQQLAAWFKGDFQSPPTNGPKPQAGKKVWLISCGQSNSTCARTIGYAGQAAKVLGWRTTVCDSKFDPSIATTCIEDAIAAKADGIYVYYQDCSHIKQALLNAKRANIPVVASEGFDCDWNNPGQAPLFDWVVQYVYKGHGNANAAWAYQYGVGQADVVIAKLKEKANALFFTDNSSSDTNLIAQGWKDEFAKCPTCKSQVIDFPISAIGTDLQQRTQEALLQHPDANSIGVEYDAIAIGGVYAGAKASGRKLFVMAGEGSPTSVGLVRSGQLGAGVGDPLDWEAWSAMDALNRLFHGEKPAPCGCGLAAFDASHNMPPAGQGYRSPVDFRAAFEKAWHVG